MKTMMLAVALMMGVSAFAIEEMPVLPERTMMTVVQVGQTTPDGFVPVKVEDLNEKVVAALKVYAETNDITALAYNAEKKLTKVSLTSKADGAQKVVVLDDEGKEYTGSLDAPVETPTETPQDVSRY